MTSFEQREAAYEAEFAHREELKFRARERAVKALAMWAAERLGKTGEEVEAYVAEVVAADVTSPTVEATIERIAAVLASASVDQVEVGRMMNRFLAEAEAPEVR